MPNKQMFISSLALVLTCAAARAGALVYVVTDSQQFGTVDLATGAFHQIGPNTTEQQANLVPVQNGSLLSLTFSGNLESIDPATGATSVIGATGLGGNAVDLASLNGKLYATDFGGNLYGVNGSTGLATLIGATGMPAVNTTPGDQFEESLYGVGGSLYATFENTTPFPSLTPLNGPSLFRISPSTGIATLVASTSLHLLSSVYANGNFYAFKGVPDAPFSYSTSQIVSLDLTNGNTSFITGISPSGTGILGASPVVPEPESIALAGIGIVGIFVLRILTRGVRPSCD